MNKLWNIANQDSLWEYGTGWNRGCADDYYRTKLPFVKYMQLFAAAGGSPRRDLLKNPADGTVTDDYDFSPLLLMCRDLVNQGLTPYIKLGNVPQKFSGGGKLSRDFGVNLLPPDDYGVWRRYIKALAETLAGEFGVETVRQWRFGSITECDNPQWFSVDNDPEKTKTAFFKLYDYTVDALQEVLGDEICIGAHFTNGRIGDPWTLWDAREFILHCAQETNYRTGRRGTRLDFISVSCYGARPAAGEVWGGWHSPEDSINHAFSKDTMFSGSSRNIICRINGFDRPGPVNMTRTLISGDSNFFDDWLADWAAAGKSIQDMAAESGWGSPEGEMPSLLPGKTLQDYEAASALKPEIMQGAAANGRLEIITAIPVNGVALYEIRVVQ